MKKLLSLSIRERDEKLLNGDITCTDEEWTLLKSWYRAELHRTDRYINSILKHLERTEQLDNTLIVITADHGDEFGEHNLFSHGHLYDSCLHVPLIMKGPNIPAEERTELVSHLDILPTFTSTADADPQPSDGGQSLFPSDGFNREAVPAEKGGDPDGDNPILDGAASAARTSEYKYIQYENKEDELYRVSEDPQEQHNLLQAETEVVDRLSSLSPDTPTVNAHEQKYADMADPSVRKRLEDLGYL